MQFATSTYDTADNSVTPCTPGLTPGKFCIGIEKRKQYFAKLWVVTMQSVLWAIIIKVAYTMNRTI